MSTPFMNKKFELDCQLFFVKMMENKSDVINMKSYSRFKHQWETVLLTNIFLCRVGKLCTKKSNS